MYKKIGSLQKLREQIANDIKQIKEPPKIVITFKNEHEKGMAIEILEKLLDQIKINR